MLENAKHEAFARAVADGSTQSAAYWEHVSERACMPKTAWECASRLLADAKVRARVAELRAQANTIATEHLALTKEEALGFLARVVRTPINQVDAGSDLCQEHSEDAIQIGGPVGKLKRGDSPEGNERVEPSRTVIRTRVKMPGKIDAVKQVAVMCGWNAPEKVEVSGPMNWADLERMALASPVFGDEVLRLADKVRVARGV